MVPLARRCRSIVLVVVVGVFLGRTCHSLALSTRRICSASTSRSTASTGRNRWLASTRRDCESEKGLGKSNVEMKVGLKEVLTGPIAVLRDGKSGQVQFSTPGIATWLALGWGMWSIAQLAYPILCPGFLRGYSTTLGTVLNMTNLAVSRKVWSAVVVIHTLEAAYAFSQANRLRWLWALQTFLVGFPSISALLDLAKNAEHSDTRQ
jgi:hypothetical protein